MVEQSERIVLRELDKYELSEKIDSSLREDNISEDCYTNFQDILIRTIVKEIHGILDRDGWKVKYFEKNAKEKIFDVFMKNGEIKVLLSKKIDKSKNEFKKVIVKFDFSEEEKKRIAEEYITNILEGYYYLDLCLFRELEEVNVDTISEALSSEVYGLLSSEEIKAKFKDKIEEAIRIINDENVIDDVDVDDVDNEEE